MDGTILIYNIYQNSRTIYIVALSLLSWLSFLKFYSHFYSEFIFIQFFILY